MSDIAIRCEGLSKLYRIGPRERYKTLRDTLTDALVSPFRRLWANSQSEIRNPKLGYAPFRRLPSLFGNSRSSIRNSQSNSTIWALKNVSFEVKPGEVVGIIGRSRAIK